MKIARYAVAFLVAVMPSLAHAGEMDLMLQKIIQQAGQPVVAPSWSKALAREGGQLFVPCLIRSHDVHATAQAIEEAGGRATIVVDDLLSAYLVPATVAAIVARPEVVVAEAATPLARKMDSARTATEVDIVQSGAVLGTAYNGTNVVVGVVDDALDYGHPDFIGSSGFTRIQYLQQTSGTTVHECTKRTIADSSCAITDGGQGTYHGTHVTGIAAGSDATFTGVAPLADIMFVFLAESDSDSSGSLATVIVDGVTTIFSKADIIDKAAVVNLSLGTSLGAHDGTSLLEQGLTALSGAKGGRIIVGAAGNEQTNPNSFSADVASHVGGIHAPIAAAPGTDAGWRIAIWNGSAVASKYTGGTVVDLWLDAGLKDSCSVAAYGYTGGRATEDFSFPGAKDTGSATLSTGDLAFSADGSTTGSGGGVTATIDVQSADARNGKPHAAILLAPSSGSGSAALETMWFDIVVRPTAAETCSGHMWLYFDAAAYHDFLTGVAGTAVTGGGGYTFADGDDHYTTTIPATATGVIAAGSFMPPKPAGAATSTWNADDGNTYDQSDPDAPDGTGTATNGLSLFSSLGPTADGRTKPDIVSPGEPIVAAKARRTSIPDTLTVGGSHFKLEGTSMASPHVTGIVALLLERNNTLTVDEVRTALRTGADPTGMTAKTADTENSFGAGKVQAAAVLGSVGVDTSLYHGTGDLDPIGGSSGCALMAKAGLGKWAAIGGLALLSAASLGLLVRCRRRGFVV